MDLASVYRDRSPSLPSKISLIGILAGIVVMVFWILYGEGGPVVSGLLGIDYHIGSGYRATALATAAVLYLVRSSITLLVFIGRKVPWSEVVTIAVWVGIIQIIMAFVGGQNQEPPGIWDAMGAALLLTGSVMHTGAEWQRHRWKARPENRGHLCTEGFWRHSRHVNYFGDLILFTGWACMTGQLLLLAIPVVMVFGFVFVNIPAQDRYLADRYGEEYQAYAKRAARLVPFLY